MRDLLADDRLEDKRPAFDPALIDSRLFEDWQINASAAVIRLDVPDIRSDEPEALQRLYPDYASAINALREAGFDVLETRRTFLNGASLLVWARKNASE